MIATELSADEYESIKDQPASEIQNEDVHGDTHRGLIDLSYDEPKDFNKGDEVEVWLEGDIMESYPPSATAKKITLKK